MAGVSGSCSLTVRLPLFLHSKTIHGIRCSSAASDNNKNNNNHKRETPQVLKVAVSGVTELLRLLSSFNKTTRLNGGSDKGSDEFSVSGIDDVVMILKSDYEKAYFVTGIFTSGIYTEDCIFEDPTIRFRGKKNRGGSLWTYLKLPWRPLISVDGSTVYDLDDKFKIVRHAESWNVTAIEAIGQLFTPTYGRSNE